MSNPLLLPELRELLSDADGAGVSDILCALHPASVAEFSEGLTIEETWRLLEYAPVGYQAQVLGFYPPSKQQEMAAGVGRERLSKLLGAMAHDDRVDFLQLVDENLVDEVLPLIAKADREDIRKLMSYPDNTAGSVMTTDYAWLPQDVSVDEAISLLRKQAPSAETIYYSYVVDEERHLVGFVSLRDLIVARPATRLRDMMHTEVVAVLVTQDQEEVAQELAKYDFLAIPVTDDHKCLLGIITHDDVLDVMMDEATEDAQHMAAVQPFDENYLDAPFVTVWRKRAGWLSCLFIAELFTFTALAYFEDAITSIVALALFVPLCISTGGNSGSQAATLITRAIALGDVSISDWWRVVKHEFYMGVALGLTLGTIGFARAAMTPATVLAGADRWLLALVISQSVAAICLWGTLVGSILPLIFQKLGFDPGYASSPFVATFVDVTGIVIYFSVATVYLL